MLPARVLGLHLWGKARCPLVLAVAFLLLPRPGGVALLHAQPEEADQAPIAGRAKNGKSHGPRLVSTTGEVRWKRAVDKGQPFSPATAPSPLNKRDEIDTGMGQAEIISDRGARIRLSQGTLLAIISGETGTDGYLARGAIQVTEGEDGQPHSVQIVTAAGRLTLRGKDVRLRIDGSDAVIEAYEGAANLWGKGAIAVRSGQTLRLQKGIAPKAPSPMAVAPVWVSTDILVVHGASKSSVPLRWEPFPSAKRYKVDLTRVDTADDGQKNSAAEDAALHVETPNTAVEMLDVPVGLYSARVTAIGEAGPLGGPGQPRRVIVAALAGKVTEKTVIQGVMPLVLTPKGLSAIVQVDGELVRTTGLQPGQRRLQVQIAGLRAEFVLEVKARTEIAAQVTKPPPGIVSQPVGPNPATPQTKGIQPPRSVVDLERPPLLSKGRPQESPPAKTPPAGTAVSMDAPKDEPLVEKHPPEDILLDGPSEIPGGGLRSPWVGPLAQARLESTTRGEMTLGVHGRFTFRNGLGADVSFAALRMQPVGDVGIPAATGNLGLVLRSPVLQRKTLALGGVVSAVLPLSRSKLDSALFEVPRGQQEITLAEAGGYRLFGGALLGLRAGRLAMHTQQGLLLQVGERTALGYQGGLAFQADATRALRVVGFLLWHVNSLGDPAEVDAGAAAGGGIEVYLPGPLSSVRIALLARAGIGEAGAAIYGRGAFGTQIGYRFR